MRIMIVEDDDLHLCFLREAVHSSELEFDTLIETSTGDEALAALDNDTVDMLVLDLQIPGKSGIDIARAAWALNPETPILFWSNYADEAYIRGIRRIAPASAVYGYLLKTSSQARLMRTLFGVLVDRQMIIDQALTSDNVIYKNEVEKLTAAEYEVLLDIAIGLTDSAIARHRSLSTRTVQGRLHSLYAKLGLSSSDTSQAVSGEDMNRRCRAVALALYHRIINTKIIELSERELMEKAGNTEFLH